jgi:DinB superfamily
MQTPEAAKLSELIHQNVAAFKEACEGVDEETASRAPSDRWSPKEIVSHLCGPEGIGLMPTFSAFVEKDLPRLDIVVEDPFFSENRARMTFAELLAEFDEEYGRIAEFVAGLSEEQLNRKAHIPFLKETPLGEYPTLSAWARILGDQHLTSHIDHMKAILKALGVGSGPLTRQTAPEAHAVPPSGM